MPRMSCIKIGFNFTTYYFCMGRRSTLRFIFFLVTFLCIVLLLFKSISPIKKLGESKGHLFLKRQHTLYIKCIVNTRLL